MGLTPPLGDDLLAALLMELADAVVVADTAGTICFWNGAAERVFGWTAEEALGASLDLIIPERQRTRHWDGYRSVMSTGTTKYGSDLLRVPSLHADGQRRSIAFTVTLLEGCRGSRHGHRRRRPRRDRAVEPGAGAAPAGAPISGLNRGT